jgi:integrase
MSMAQQDSRKLERTKYPGIYKRSDGFYVVMYRHRGRQHKKVCRTLGLAREFKNQGGTTKAPDSRKTVESYGVGWIDGYRGRTARGLDDETRSQYRRSLEHHITPRKYLGGVKLRDLGSSDISDWFGRLERDGVPPATIRKAKRCLSAMLATAAQDGAISHNPALGVRYVPAPAIAERERLAQAERKRRALSADQVLAVIAAMPDQWHVFFSLLAETGCRVSELIGLRWENVHLGDEPHVYVCEQWKDGRHKRLKTDASEEPVPLSPPMAQWLGQMRPQDAAGPVFPSMTGTPLNYSNLYNRVLLPAADAAGVTLPPRRAFHAFRDACASLIIDSGGTVQDVKTRLRHAQLSTSMGYVKETGDGHRTADTLGARLWGNAGATTHPQATTDETAEHGSPAGESRPPATSRNPLS